jgi:mono/diheme cytochrome c family protein
MTTIWCGLAATTTIALVATQVGLSVQSHEQAQTLLAPSFTTAQAAAGRATYTENCASCHGANLDDGAFGPALRGPEFRASWFGRSADQLFTKLETMPPAAPASLGASRTAEVLAYLMSQNQLVAADKPVSSNLDELKGMLLPGATGGPSGGLTGGVPIPPSPRKANPLDRLTPVTDALLANPPRANG